MHSTQFKHWRKYWIQWSIIFVAWLIFIVVLVLPLYEVVSVGLADGFSGLWQTLTTAETIAALKLTLLVTAITVPLNMIFGLTAAWSICRLDFKGKNLLLTLIDLPFSVSPVVVGLMYVLLFGEYGGLAHYLQYWDIKIIHALPGLVLVTIFVTIPFVARELIAVMEAQGNEEEEAALILGASGWQTFLHVTLPNIKWALLHGVVLSSARALGEFGAVSVVAGELVTLPLHLEVLLYNNSYNTTAAFAVAILLLLLSLVLLFIRQWTERYMFRSMSIAR